MTYMASLCTNWQKIDSFNFWYQSNYRTFKQRKVLFFSETKGRLLIHKIGGVVFALNLLLYTVMMWKYKRPLALDDQAISDSLPHLFPNYPVWSSGLAC